MQEEPNSPLRAADLSASASPAVPQPEGSVPLVVDMDGALLRVDAFHEGCVNLFAGGLRDVLGAVPLVVSALRRKGAHPKAAIKAAVAARAPLDAAALPLRDEVLDLIREARAEGRRVILATAADQRVADAVASHVGLFDEVCGSDGIVNLGGAAKAAWLVDRFGRGGFDYVGDHARDLPVWAEARRAITVAAPSALVRRVEAQTHDRPSLHLAPPPSAARRIHDHIRALRPHQWLKNLLLFLPILAAHITAAEVWQDVTLGFIAFSLTASSVYCLNDLLDLEADRAHPRKRRRPFASGDVPALHGVWMGASLLVAGFWLAWAVSPLLFGVLTVYFGATLLYSFVLKRELVIDICVLAGLYTLRVIAGSAAADLQLSPWMLALSVFLFLALAAMKRQTELVDLARSGRSESSGRAYRAEDLNVVTMMAIAAGYTAVLVLALYIYSPAVQQLYASPLLLWGAPPILLYWISRLVMIAHRGGMNDDPVLFAVKDRISVASAAGMLAFAAAAKLL